MATRISSAGAHDASVRRADAPADMVPAAVMAAVEAVRAATAVDLAPAATSDDRARMDRAVAAASGLVPALGLPQYVKQSYGLQGMGSVGYLAKSGAGAARKKGAGIPKSLVQTGIQKLETLDYAVGDRVKHIKFGEGTVEAIEDGKKDYTVTVNFDTAGQKKMLASFAKLKKL